MIKIQYTLQELGNGWLLAIINFLYVWMFQQLHHLHRNYKICYSRDLCVTSLFWVTAMSLNVFVTFLPNKRMTKL